MLRGLYTTGAVIALLYMTASIFLYIYVSDLRHSSYYNSYDYSYYSSSSRPHVSATRLIGALSALVFLFYIFIFIMGMVKVRNATVLVLGIIGLLFTAVSILIDLIMLANKSITFDEVGAVFTTWAFFMLSFCIPCAILTGAKQLEEQKRKKEMQQMMFNNQQYMWHQYYQQQQQYNPQQQQYNPNQQQQYFNPNQQQQYFNPNQQQQNTQNSFNQSFNNNQNTQANSNQQQNPYQYFNPYNPVPPQQNNDTPPENKV